MTLDTAPAPATAQATPTESLTPTLGEWWRRQRKWIFITLGVLIVTAITVLALGSNRMNSGRDLDPDSAAPNGALAIVRTLESHGVDVERADSLETLNGTVGESTTVLVYDRGAILQDWQWDELRALGVDRLIVIPSSQASRMAVADVATVVGYTSPPEEPATHSVGDQCPAPLATNAPTLSDLGGAEYAPAGDAVGCWQVRDGYAVVMDATGTTEVVVIAQPGFLANGEIADNANAATAIGLLGAHEQFVWYEPGMDDLASSGPTFGSYIPQWLLPATLLLLLAGLAATVWRGRRFGPLVSERLPVAVPASETLEGRARLYDHSDSRLRALDAIRIGTVTRLAELLGLGRDASAQAVADAAAGAARVPREHAHQALVGGDPGNDTNMVDLANACAEIERRVRAALGREQQPKSNDTDPRNRA